MPKIKPEYEIVEGFGAIAQALYDKYPEIFGGINVESIRCYAIANKERPSNKKLWDVRAISYPIRLDCPFGWYVVIWKKDWDDMSEKVQSRLVASILLSVGEEGSVNPFDLKDHAAMIRTFGVDYLENDEGPDLIKEDVQWVTSSVR